MIGSYPSAKMFFSVIPIKAVAHALTNIRSPKNTWTSRYEALTLLFNPGNRKVINPNSH